MTVSNAQRHRPGHLCRVCQGHDAIPRGRGERCYGFDSDDGVFAHCSRPEHAGGLALGSDGCYAHILDRPCDCGVDHRDGAVVVRANGRSGGGNIATGDVTDNARVAQDLYKDAQPAGERVHAYFVHRGLAAQDTPDDWRYAPSCNHPAGGRHPAIILPFRTVAGEIVGVQRIFLDRDGPGKASIKPNKAMLGPVGGAAIHIGPDAETVIVCEGPETGLALHRASGWTVWITGSTSGLKNVELPDQTRHVIVAGDNDEAGVAAAEMAVARFCTQGRTAVLMLPKKAAQDWLDVLTDDGVGVITETLDAVMKSMLNMPTSDKSETIVAPVASSEVSEDESQEPWDPPLSLDNPILPAFPVDTLPAPLRAMVIEEAIATQTPPGLAAMMGLSVLATAVQKKAIVQVGPGYSQPLNLYVAVLMPSGTRKSQVVSDLTAPISARQSELADSMQAEIAEAQTEHDVLKERLDQTKHEAAKAKNPDEAKSALQESQQLARALAAMNVPHSPRLLAEDVTPEKLGALMADQGGKMAVLSAEGTLFSIIAGRYSKNGTPQLELFLKAHDGEDIYIDRISRPTVHLDAPALTLGLAVQPDVVISLGEIPAMRERGLIPRFLYWRPPSLLGRRAASPPPVSDRTRRVYHRLIKALLDLPAGTDADGQPAPHVLTLAAEARDQWIAFVSEMEPDLAEQGDWGTIADWASKVQGTTNRIAALLHLADHTDARAPWETPIAGSVMERAIAIARACIPHAYAVLTDMGLDPSLHDARYLARVLEGWNRTQFAKRDLHQKTRGKLKTMAQFDRALAVLEEHGYVRMAVVHGDRKPGRPASPIYFLNPQTDPHNSHKAVENPLEAISEDYEDRSVEVETDEGSLACHICGGELDGFTPDGAPVCAEHLGAAS